jgi:hypothetical protein
MVGLYHGGYKSRSHYGSSKGSVKVSLRMRKGVSQQQEHVNGVNTNQRSNEVKYDRPI